MVLIGLSIIKLITETYINDIQAVDLPTVYRVYYYIEWGYTVVFTFEALMKMIRAGLYKERGSYLRDPWSWLDILIVLGSLADVIIDDPRAAIFKILRLLRPLRLIL